MLPVTGWNPWLLSKVFLGGELVDSPLDVYDLVIFGLLLVLATNALLNACLFPVVRRRKVKARARDSNGDPPLVSILVPARNEAHQIEHCLRSLQNQCYARTEVIVLDDCSEDGTSEVIRELGFGESADSRHRLLKGEPLPSGWTGKPWACHQLANAASGDFLLFTDADTVHDQASVESAVSYATRRGTDLLSVWPHQVTISWAEKLVVPMIYWLAFTCVPLWFVSLAQRVPRLFGWLPRSLWERLGVANGQYLLFSRAAYEELGGHACVKHHLVEDVELGRAVLKRLPSGWRLANADGHHIVECRMYQNFVEVWEGFSKNLRPVFARRWYDFTGLGILLLITTLLPFFFFLGREQPWLVTLQLETILLVRLLVTLRFQTSWWSLFLHPISMLLSIGIALNSWWLSRTGGITWKRRGYDWDGQRSREVDPLLDDPDR